VRKKNQRDFEKGAGAAALPTVDMRWNGLEPEAVTGGLAM